MRRHHHHTSPKKARGSKDVKSKALKTSAAAPLDCQVNDSHLENLEDGMSSCSDFMVIPSSPRPSIADVNLAFRKRGTRVQLHAHADTEEGKKIITKLENVVSKYLVTNTFAPTNPGKSLIGRSPPARVSIRSSYTDQCTNDGSSPSEDRRQMSRFFAYENS